jgi:hypothetical protein
VALDLAFFKRQEKRRLIVVQRPLWLICRHAAESRDRSAIGG